MSRGVEERADAQRTGVPWQREWTTTARVREEPVFSAGGVDILGDVAEGVGGFAVNAFGAIVRLSETTPSLPAVTVPRYICHEISRGAVDEARREFSDHPLLPGNPTQQACRLSAPRCTDELIDPGDPYR